MLRAVATHADGATVADVAAEIGGHPNTARRRLQRLVGAGLVEQQLTAATSGRPPHAFRLTEAGRAALEPGPDSFQQVVRAMAAHAETTPEPSATALEIGRRWGLRRGGDEEMRHLPVEAALVVVMAEHGFAPAATDDGLLLRACPLLAEALDHPDFVCPLHAGLAEGVVAATGTTATVELEPFASPAGCLLRLVA